MTREELKEHCLKEIKICEIWARLKGEDTRRKLYEEHNLILELLEHEPRWIPIITRKPTEEEKKDYFEQNGEELCYMIDSPMPGNGQEVLVSAGEHVSEDVFDEDFYNFENNDIENVDAWMPKPKAYKAESRENE